MPEKKSVITRLESAAAKGEVGKNPRLIELFPATNLHLVRGCSNAMITREYLDLLTRVID